MSEELWQLEQEIKDLRQRMAYLEQGLEYQAKQIAALKGLGTNRANVSFEAKADLSPPPLREEPKPHSLEPKHKWREEKKSKSAGLDEQVLAGTWFNRLGIVAILLALAFFLKWSFDNNLVGNLGRVVIGILLGLAFLGAGELFQRKGYTVYGQGFTGGGIAILYFSIFAAFGIYRLVSQPVAFGLMVLITAAASLLAVKYDALAIGILGIVGGFATPFLLSNGSSNMFALFTYIVILDAGVFVVAYFKKWHVFNYITFLLTYLTFTVWYVVDYRSSQMWLSLLYLTIFFAAYLGVSFIRNIRLGERTNPADLTLIFLNATAYFALSYSLLARHYSEYMGFFSVLLGIIYVLLGNFTYRTNQEDPNLSLTFLGVAAGFITLAIPLQLKGYWIAIAWAAEGVAVMWLSFRYESIKARFTGLALLGLAVIYLLSEPFVITGRETVLLINRASGTYLAVIALIGLAAYLISREDLEPIDRNILSGLVIAANIMAIILITREIQAYYRYLLWSRSRAFYSTDARDLTLSIAWGLYASVLIVIGFIRKLKAIRLFSLGFLAIVILKVFLFDLSALATPFRILSFVVLGVLLLAISWLYQRYKHFIIGEEQQDEVPRNF